MNFTADASGSNKGEVHRSTIFNLKPIDLPDQIELMWSVKYNYLEGTLSRIDRSSRVIHLLQLSSGSFEKYKDINDALLYGIIAKDPQLSNESFQMLHSIMQDQWEYASNQAKYFTFTSFQKLTINSKSRLLWLVGKLVALQARGTDNLCVGLIRNIKGGDNSTENIWLIQSLHQIFTLQKDWLYQQPTLIPFCVYAFLRLISQVGLDIGLKNDLSKLVVSLLNDKFKECSVIGRDLIRILQDVAKIPEFAPIWISLYRKSSDTDDSLLLIKLLKIPTPKRFVVCRLTPELENNILFLLEAPQYGTHKRYLEWMANDYFSIADPESLMIDMIRFIIVGHHPSNAILASSVIQRWQVIGWLFRLMRNTYSSANAKLALFYDWLFFDPDIDSIMNIEPAILLATNSVQKQPNITSSLIEFLYLVSEKYLSEITPMIRRSIDRAMYEVLSKHVVNHLEMIFRCDGINNDIKKMLAELTPCYSLIMDMRNSKRAHLKLEQSQKPREPSQAVHNYDLFESLNILGASIGNSGITEDEVKLLFNNFIIALGSAEDAQVEKVTSELVSFTEALTNFQDSLKIPSNLAIWSNGFLKVLTDPSIDKDIIDRAIERISLLPQGPNGFNIEDFVHNHIVSLKEVENSPSNHSINEPLPMDVDISNNNHIMDSSFCRLTSTSNLYAPHHDGVEIKETTKGFIEILRSFKTEDEKSFYKTCLTGYKEELTELKDPFGLMYLLVNQMDPFQLICVKNQLLQLNQGALFTQRQESNFFTRLGETLRWESYEQIFMWDIVCFELQCNATSRSNLTLLQSILDNLPGDTFNSEVNPELTSGLLRLIIEMSGCVSDEFLVENVVLELVRTNRNGECVYENDMIGTILMSMWKRHPDLFIQSISKLEQSYKGTKANILESIKTNLQALYRQVLEIDITSNQPGLLDNNQLSSSVETLAKVVDANIKMLN